MDYLPLFLRLEDTHCLLVGGGEIAARKSRLLLAAGAELKVVAPALGAELAAARDAGRIVHLAREFRAGDLDGMRLVVAATDGEAVNAAVAAAAKSRNVFCNVVDDRERSDAIMPAIVDRSPLVVAISTGGASPVIARRMRERIERALPHGIAALTRLAGRWRRRVAGRFADLTARRRFWERVLDGEVGRLAEGGRVRAAERALERSLAGAEADAAPRGEAWLVGAGPGDPSLLTLRALNLLQQAEVVLHDRLVSREVLALARRDATRIEVGKSPGGHCMPQSEINALLVELVAAGKRVCRLKGGDPFVFGRGGEEVEALAAAGLSYQVVPGITAAAGCAAYAGIPLTHRDHAQSVVLLTAHGRESVDRLDWPSLARDRQTLAFYMGVARAPDIRRELIAHGRSPETPAAIVESGTTAAQRVLRGRLDELPATIARHRVRSPAMLIIGEVAGVDASLQWSEDARPAPKLRLAADEPSTAAKASGSAGRRSAAAGA